MKIQFSLAQHTVPFWSPPEMIYNAASIGYDMVGIRIIRQGIAEEGDFDLVNDSRLMELTKEALKETGIQIHDIDLAMIDRKRDVSDYEPALAAAKELGVRGVIASIWTNQMEVYLDQFSRLCDLAARYHLAVYLEYVTWASISNLQAAKAVLELVKKPNAKLLVDVLHHFRSQVTVEELEQCPEEWFELLHLCDAPMRIPDTQEELIETGRSKRLYVGEGAADIAGIARRMGRDAVFAIEIPHRRRMQELGAYEHAKRCLDTSKAYLREHSIL